MHSEGIRVSVFPVHEHWVAGLTSSHLPPLGCPTLVGEIVVELGSLGAVTVGLGDWEVLGLVDVWGDFFKLLADTVEEVVIFGSSCA